MSSEAVVACNGMLVVIAGPSGAGKHTVIRRFRELDSDCAHTVSATTRAPRTGEREGEHYYFLARATFQERITSGDFLEWAEVHGNLYGTLLSELDRCVHSAPETILELDVQGMRSLRRLGYDIISIFIMPPSLEELEHRLRNRGTDSDEVIALRLANAEAELAARGEFDYIVVNDSLERAVSDVAAIFRAERCRAYRQQ
jgi:guanylate kinase